MTPNNDQSEPGARVVLATALRQFQGSRGPLRRALALAVVGAVLDAMTLLGVAVLVASVRNSADTISADAYGLSVAITFWALLAVTALLLALRVAFVLQLRRAEARLTVDYEARLRRRLARAFISATWETQTATSSGQLQQYLNAHVGRSQTALRALTVGAAELSGLCLLLLGAVLAAGPVTVVTLLVLGLIGAAVRPLHRRSRAASTAQSDLAPAWGSAVDEMQSMAVDTRLLRLDDLVFDRTDSLISELEVSHRKELFFTSATPLAYEVAGLLLVLAGLLAVRTLDLENITAIGAGSILLVRALLNGRNVQNQYQVLSNLLPYSVELSRKIDELDRACEPDGLLEIDQIRSIRFTRVSYAYQEAPAVRDLDFLITQGSSVGIIGPSGAGKSTILQLLLRLRRPTQGTIEVNGVDIGDIAASSLYGRMSVVQQEPRLYDATMRDNVSSFDSAISTDQIWAALDAVGLAQFTEERGGLDFRVGRGGAALSGGQRQRVALARAIAREPDFLILDEPTGALDAHTEAAIQRTLRTLHGSTTLIVVAHRLSTLSLCDDILILESGAVRAYGPRVELAQSDAYYREALELSGLTRP